MIKKIVGRRRIYGIWRQIVATIVLVAHSSSLWGATFPPESCFFRLNKQSLVWADILNYEAKEDLVPAPQLTFRLPDDPTLPMFQEGDLIAGFVVRIYNEIKRQSVKSFTTYMWEVTDERLEGRANAKPERIPDLVAQAFTDTRSTSAERNKIREYAAEVVAELQKNHVPRMKNAEVIEEIQTNIQGLESIRVAITEGRASYTDYAAHLNYILSTSSGKLLTAAPLKGLVKLMRTPEELDQPIEISVDPWQVRQAQKLFYDQFRAQWSTSQSGWRDARAAFAPVNGAATIPDGTGDPYFWLAKFIESAPRAVVQVIKENPGYRQHLCWMLGQLDRRLMSDLWGKSITTLTNKIMLPLWILGVAVIPVILAGAPLAIMFAGIAVLEVATFASMHDSYKQMLASERERGVHEAMMTSGLGSPASVDFMIGYQNEIQAAGTNLAITAAIEVGSIGFAKGLSVFVRNSVKALKPWDLAQRLYRASMRTNFGRGHTMMSQNFAEQLGRKMTYKQFLLSNNAALVGRRLSYQETQRLWVHHVVEKMSQSEIDDLLFASREFGFGKSLFFTEVGVAFAGQAYNLATGGMFDEIKPWEYLIPNIPLN